VLGTGGMLVARESWSTPKEYYPSVTLYTTKPTRTVTRLYAVSAVRDPGACEGRRVTRHGTLIW